MLIAEKPIHKITEDLKGTLQTPYYLIDESKLLKNLKIIERVREQSGAKSVLALKCFSTWSVFDLMRQYMDGTTSSSLFEAKLGFEKFGKEVHAYGVAFSQKEVEDVSRFATKIIFNSISQLKRFLPLVKGKTLGLRINPGMSYSDFDLADPARRCSRLGVTSKEELKGVEDLISGVMFHYNCENHNFKIWSGMLDKIGQKYGALLKKLKWVSLGGGIYFTKDDYPIGAFCAKLKEFSKAHNVQVYLEPGETAVTRSTYLVTKVLDIIHNEVDVAIVDSAVEPHMLDLLIYQGRAKLENPSKEGYTYQVAGRTCLAGDIFGTYTFREKLKVGDLIPFFDAGGYTMVKKNWFNGVPMPSIVVRRLSGEVEVVRQFQYQDYITNLS